MQQGSRQGSDTGSIRGTRRCTNTRRRHQPTIAACSATNAQSLEAHAAQHAFAADTMHVRAC